MSAGWLPSERTLFTLADIMAGGSPNGTKPAEVEPTWRGVLAHVGAMPSEQRLQMLEVELAHLGLSDEEMSVFHGALIKVNLSKKKPDVPRPAIELLSRADLRSRPKPQWLVQDTLQLRSAAELFGPSGIGKSFLGLSLACAVATGRAWFGLEVVQGPVVYIAAEGDDDIDNRISAWEREYWAGKMIENFTLIPEGLNFRSGATPETLLRILREARADDPKLIVIDTLARNMEGDENSTEHMSQFIRQVDVLWRETGCTVLLVHHTGKSGDQERGSSTVRGGVNTMLRFTQDAENRTIRLTCDKQKNGRPFSPWTFVMKEVPADDVGGMSCVLDLAAGQQQRQKLPPLQSKILDVLSWSMHVGGVTASRLRESLGLSDETGRTSIYPALNRLHTLGYILASGETRGQIYAITDLGRDILRFAQQGAE